MNFLTYFIAASMVISHALGFTYRDNDVKFSLRASQVQGYTINYLVQSHSITDNQDPNNHIRDNITGRDDNHVFNSQATLSYSIGRKGSDKVAGWWNREAGANTFGHTAGSLNFALGGTLTFGLSVNGAGATSFRLDDIYIGQGSSGSSNNWWFGGKKCTHQDPTNAQCEAVDSQGGNWYFVFKRGGNDANLVELFSVTRR
ncbi:hypothetical protein CYLTODRAFT_459381 [Cylindrobasidium torrendii FP15055 ss-10]|uniref:Uncharacterized protein n=1 Tax=Cylindrobasidium torrendii FP15055 ss-10 TaxID=1314674 RepID=A0A0D7AUE6_9AGAR|nr:hypothetical protein CYLTODRAFT_459381 [Cylindrobasidium torrendii FP15055 ss-10]